MEVLSPQSRRPYDLSFDSRMTGKPERTQLGKACRSGNTGTSPEPVPCFCVCAGVRTAVAKSKNVIVRFMGFLPARILVIFSLRLSRIQRDDPGSGAHTRRPPSKSQSDVSRHSSSHTNAASTRVNDTCLPTDWRLWSTWRRMNCGTSGRPRG
jgi:hypothetical protein